MTFDYLLDYQRTVTNTAYFTTLDSALVIVLNAEWVIAGFLSAFFAACMRTESAHMSVFRRQILLTRVALGADDHLRGD